MTIKDFMDEKMFGVVFILARYFYRIGEPVVSDAYYDSLEKFLRENYYDSFQHYLTRTYDEDPVPEKYLRMMGINPVVSSLDTEKNTELYHYLNEDKSFSIASVTSYEETFPFFQRAKDKKLDVVISLKVDGVNTKMLYVDEEFAMSLSRGRAEGNSFDYTENSAKIMPLKFKTGKKMVKVVGESFVIDEGLPILRNRYGKPDGYVSGKSSAISLLRVKHALQDYSYLRTKVFSIEVGKTLVESFQIAEKAGFDIVPYFLVSWEEIPDSLEEFKQWAKTTIFDRMWKEGKGIPSDGVVAEINDFSFTGTQHHQYVDRQLAMKFEQWSYQVYKSTITNIKIEQQRINKSVLVEIDPIVTSDGNTARVVNVHNPAILISNNLHVGATIYFERNSNAINTVIYGDRLKEVCCEPE